MSRHYTIWGKKRKSSYRPKKSGKYKNKDSEQADIRIKYCIFCRCCWEKETGRDSDMVRYYKGFVTYGKTREKCPKCSKSDKPI